MTKRKDWVGLSPEARKQVRVETMKRTRVEGRTNHDRTQIAQAKYRLFAAEYVKDLNADRAGKAVGYKGKGTGSGLLSDEYVQKCIAEEMAKRAERMELDQNWVIEHLVELVERCMQKTAVIRWDYDVKGMAQAKDENGNGIWAFDSRGASKGLELLGRHLRMFTDKLEVGDSGDPMERIMKARERASGKPRGEGTSQQHNAEPVDIECARVKQAQQA